MKRFLILFIITIVPAICFGDPPSEERDFSQTTFCDMLCVQAHDCDTGCVTSSCDSLCEKYSRHFKQCIDLYECDQFNDCVCSAALKMKNRYSGSEKCGVAGSRLDAFVIAVLATVGMISIYISTRKKA